MKHPHPGQSQLSGRNLGAGRLAFSMVVLPSPPFFCLRLRGIGADEPWWLFRHCSASRSSGVVRDRSGLLSRCLARTRDRLSLWCQDSGTLSNAAVPPPPAPVRAPGVCCLLPLPPPAGGDLGAGGVDLGGTAGPPAAAAAALPGARFASAVAFWAAVALMNSKHPLAGRAAPQSRERLQHVTGTLVPVWCK